MSTTTLPYFKLDSGKFLAEVMGYTHIEVGIYIRLKAIYWERCCRLPARESLERSLHISKKPEREALTIVLENFFPDGVNEHLDLCQQEASAYSRAQSERAKKGHSQRQLVVTTDPDNPTDF